MRKIPPEIAGISKLPWLVDVPGQAYHLGLSDGSLMSVRLNASGRWEIYEHRRRTVNLLYESPDLRNAIKLAETTPVDRQDRGYADWRNEEPTKPQATRLWMLDWKIRKQWKSDDEFYRYCRAQYRAGQGYTKGDLSNMINARQRGDTITPPVHMGPEHDTASVAKFTELLRRHYDGIEKVCVTIAPEIPFEAVLLSCLRAIFVSDHLTKFAPSRNDSIAQWTERITLPGDYRRLIRAVMFRLECRYNELRQLEAEQQEQLRAKKQIEYNHVVYRRNEDLIQKFLEIAEREVSVPSEYDDETWEALPREIRKCLGQIMHDDGKRKAEIITFFKTDGASGHGPEWEAYRWLRSELRNKFEEYHSANRCLESDETLDLNRLTGPQFETYVGRTLEKRGYDIRYTPRTGDQGGDLIAKKDGRTIVVQVKRSSRPVGNDAVQEVTAALKIYSGDEGWVVTNATFTPAAKKLAHANVVRLIDGVELRSLAGGS